jgi:hypothetical protein
VDGTPLALVPVDVAGDLSRSLENAVTYGASCSTSPVLGSRLKPHLASTARNCGSVIIAACPMPFIAARESRNPTVCSPRHEALPHTRALICRWMCRCGSPALDVW